MKSAVTTSSTRASVDLVVDEPSTPMAVTRARPTRIAVAVAAVRRRSRWALRTASVPTEPKRVTGAPTAPTRPRLNTGSEDDHAQEQPERTQPGDGQPAREVLTEDGDEQRHAPRAR